MPTRQFCLFLTLSLAIFMTGCSKAEEKIEKVKVTADKKEIKKGISEVKETEEIKKEIKSKKIEFDGVYLKIQNGDYKEIRSVKTYRTQLGSHKGSFLALANSPRYNYILSKKGMISIPINDFKGFVFKGKYSLKYLRFNFLKRKYLKKYRVFENKGPSLRGKSFIYTAGAKIQMRSKPLEENAQYFEPREPLKKGEYVARIGRKFWLFKIE